MDGVLLKSTSWGCAYEPYEQRGHHDGQELDDWLQRNRKRPDDGSEHVKANRIIRKISELRRNHIPVPVVF